MSKFVPTWAKRMVRPVRQALRVRREFRADRRRYARYRMPEDGGAHERLRGRNLEAQITKDYHRVEKGLALRTPKRPFGDAVQNRLEMLLPLAPRDAAYVAAGESALKALQTWNSDGIVDSDISPTSAPRSPATVPDEFFTTRHSVRDFSTMHVDDSVLQHALELAVNSPSVCNRQPWRVRFLRGKDNERARRYQNGNAGFGEIPVLALVTVDLRFFAASGERNQAWIEGGLFSMSLVWALHAQGVDTCMLNMSVDNARAAEVRKVFDLDEAEVIIMMIAIGYGTDSHRYARSPRRSVSELIPNGRLSSTLANPTI